MRLNVVEMTAADDPRSYIMNKVGDLKGHRLLGDRVLIATYMGTGKSPGGIIIPDKTVEEARFQGKVGLVLKIGPMAFKYDGPFAYEGDRPSVGDWVMYFPVNAREFFLGGRGGKGGDGISCRQIRSEFVETILDNPDSIY